MVVNTLYLTFSFLPISVVLFECLQSVHIVAYLNVGDTGHSKWTSVWLNGHKTCTNVFNI